MGNPVIQRVEVEGLYDQIDIDLSLKPGLNVIFGKNGRGKTTLLHILANALELDFQRFQFLQFRVITLTTVGGARLKIHKIPGDVGVSLSLNEMPVGSHTSSGLEVSAAERQLLREHIGARPIYLPAFRSIIERVRSDGTTYTVSGRDAELELAKEHERQAEKDGDVRVTQFGRYRDLATVNARKTIQCREWFGKFVPAIRYPAIVEVAERLLDDYRDARLELGFQDSLMLSEMFVEVFRALLSEEVVPSDLEVETLIGKISHSLSTEKDRHEEDSSMDRIGASLSDVIEKVKNRGPHKEEAAERRVLKLYVQMLERRNQERKKVIARFRSFEDAVNGFLEGKALRVREESERALRRELASRREIGGVYVESDDGGRKYALTALSSGERQVLTMLFSASRLSTSEGLFLVDEPEISLHVDWQRKILKELSVQAGDRQIIVCTHAPEVGADHISSLQNFSPRKYREPNLFDGDESFSDSQLDDLN